MTELQKCLMGTSLEPHADKVAALYNHLRLMGNNEIWQLAVLKIISEGIEARIEEIERNVNVNRTISPRWT